MNECEVKLYTEVYLAMIIREESRFQADQAALNAVLDLREAAEYFKEQV